MIWLWRSTGIIPMMKLRISFRELTKGTRSKKDEKKLPEKKVIMIEG